MMYCERCKSFFEDPIEEKEDPSPNGVNLPEGYYVYYTCPFCGSDAIDEASQCKLCGEWIPHGEVCEKCDAEILRWLDLMVESFEGDVSDNREVIFDRIAEVFL